jgi:hypothetical protein
LLIYLNGGLIRVAALAIDLELWIIPSGTAGWSRPSAWPQEPWRFCD